MSEFNLSFNDVMNEIFDTGAEYIREDWDNDCNTVITESHGEIVCLTRNKGTFISPYAISKKALHAKYKRIPNFSKADLKYGMIVKLLSEQYYFISKSLCNEELILLSFNTRNDFNVLNLNEYKNNLIHKGWSKYNIIEAYEFKDDALLGECLSIRNQDSIRSFFSIKREQIIIYRIKN